MCSSPKAGLTIKAPASLDIALKLNDKNFHTNFRQSNENVARLEQQRMREFESNEPPFQQHIEVHQLRYPFHILQLKESLKQLADPQTLKISSLSKTLIKDLSATARILGYQTQTLRFRRQYFLYTSKLFH